MSNDEVSIKINRLKWHSRRSMLEVDLYLDKFIQNGELEKLSLTELAYYEEVLELEDSDLLLLFQGKGCLKDLKKQSIINKVVAVMT